MTVPDGPTGDPADGDPGDDRPAGGDTGGSAGDPVGDGVPERSTGDEPVADGGSERPAGDRAGDGPGRAREDREPYRTVAGRGRSSFTVRGSEFLGHVAPVEGVAAAESLLDGVREAHDDATHVVPAYRVRVDAGGRCREYAGDDGEPAGTAGDPALSVLQGRDLENVVAAVVRYYGGTNLGTGGLARAYSRAVAEAVADAGVHVERPHLRATIVVDYDDSGDVRGLLESAGVEFEADYRERVTFRPRVPVADAEELFEQIRSVTSGRASIER